MLETAVVAQCQHEDRRHERTDRDRHEAESEIPREITHQPEDIGSEETAKIAERVDQGDATGGRGARQHRRGQ